MTKYANLSDDRCRDIVKKIDDIGLLKLEDGLPTKIIMCNDVKCPLCNSPLEVYTNGKSYHISCPNDGRISVVRAFSNASYFEEQAS